MAKKNVQEIVQKEMPEFADEINGLSGNDLNMRLSKLAQDVEQVTESQENDSKLEEMRNQLKEAVAPYRDAKKALRLKSKYIIARLKELGQVDV